MTAFAIIVPLLLAQPAQGPCLTRFKQLNPTFDCSAPDACPRTDAEACKTVANSFANERLARQVELQVESTTRVATRPEGLQPAAPDGTSGTATQISAAPSIRTVGLVAASIAGTTSPDEPPAVIVRFNPLGIGAWDSKAFAERARFSDVAVVLPAGGLEGGRPGFIGLRGNLNVLAFTKTNAEFKKLATTLDESARRVWGEAGPLATRLTERLNAMTNEKKEACLQLLFADVAIDAGELEHVCGMIGVVAALEAERQLASAVKAFRDVADDENAGLNLAIDLPLDTASIHPFRAAGTLVGDFNGRRAGWIFGVRLAAAGDVLSRAGRTSGGGSLASDLYAERPVADFTRLSLDVGLKGHLGGDFEQDILPPDQNLGDYLNLKAGLRAPLGKTGMALSVGVIWPIAGDGAGPPIVTSSIDYAYLAEEGGVAAR